MFSLLTQLQEKWRYVHEPILYNSVMGGGWQSRVLFRSASRGSDPASVSQQRPSKSWIQDV